MIAALILLAATTPTPAVSTPTPTCNPSGFTPCVTPTPSTTVPTPTPSPVPTTSQKYCHKNSGGCFPWPPSIGLTCDAFGDAINNVPCVVETPTPAPTATPTPSAAAGPQPLGSDPYQTAPCFVGVDGSRAAVAGMTYCDPARPKAQWVAAGDVEPVGITVPGTATWVPLGLSTRMKANVAASGDHWTLSASTNTIDFACPVAGDCNGYYWVTVNQDVPQDVQVDDDLYAMVQASWALTPAAAPAEIQFSVALDLPDKSGWAQLDVVLGITPAYPQEHDKPGYVAVAPVDFWKAGDGLRYYVQVDGSAWGLTPASNVMHTWQIPLTAIIRRARADNPTAFPVPDNATLGNVSLNWQQLGHTREDVEIQEFHVWSGVPQ